ncbi:hypothetical protein BCR36DRAFT_411925 [Piromyces finnis]|uniref:Uncharacterized protein n=1 Tax=Piromyces finnis TaxID=1754191 RepID=A0A1Y1VAT0_9FUNG|nr:hypothetical protein BCR36DRAFT_411925 [Piromyces finnis]|eukprot:ORX51464.1 hypothetical protein BCR36DRAFT_411925 [Piromyces finnis]
MSYHTISQKNSVTVKSTDSTATKNPSTPAASEQLNSTAKVFCEACNQIVKSYLSEYHETNGFQTISLSYAQKVIKKTKISFSQLVVTLVYLNRFYHTCTLFKKHIPGHEEAIIPSLSHVVLLCIIQAERYVTDIPHKLTWWAGICAGQTKASDINKWQRDFFDTINYQLYVHPEKDFNIFKVEVKRLAARLFSNSVAMPPQFRRSVCSGGSQSTPVSTPSSQPTIQQLPSQPNVISTRSSNVIVQPRILLSPLYSGHSDLNQQPITILSSQTNMLTSPLPSDHSENSIIGGAQTRQNLDVPVLNITNTNLTTSPVELSDNSLINQTRSPNSIYNNSISNDTHQLNVTSPLPPVQNPNNLMVQTNSRSPSRNFSSSQSTSSLLVLSNSQQNTPKQSLSPTTIQYDAKQSLSPTTIQYDAKQSLSPTTIQYGAKQSLSPATIQYGITMTNSPETTKTLDQSIHEMIKKEDIQITKTLSPCPINRKRSYYDKYSASLTENILKTTQNIKRTKIAMTISPEELNFQPNIPKSRPLEEN